MSNLVISLEWDVLENAITDVIEEEMEVTESPPDTPLFAYNYRGIREVPWRYIESSCRCFCLMGPLSTLLSDVVEYISYNYQQMDCDEEHFIVHYVVMGMVHLLDMFITDVAVGIYPDVDLDNYAVHDFDVGKDGPILKLGRVDAIDNTLS